MPRYATNIGISARVKSCIFLLLFSALCATAPFASAQQITGSLTGTVKDPEGALITTATVRAQNVDTHFTRQTQTDSGGVFSIQYLPVGRYTVEVAATGFKKFLQQNIVLTVDQTQTINVTLNIGGTDQTITVTDAPPMINTTSSSLGRTVEGAEITGLPLVNRNVYAEISLTRVCRPTLPVPAPTPQAAPTLSSAHHRHRCRSMEASTRVFPPSAITSMVASI